MTHYGIPPQARIHLIPDVRSSHVYVNTLSKSSFIGVLSFGNTRGRRGRLRFSCATMGYPIFINPRQSHGKGHELLIGYIAFTIDSFFPNYALRDTPSGHNVRPGYSHPVSDVTRMKGHPPGRSHTRSSWEHTRMKDFPRGPKAF